MPLTIDVVSDVVCPWCYIGKRKLESALEQYRAANPAAEPPVVRWHPFQLNPDLPDAGMARRDYLQAKFGSPSGGPGYDRVRAAGASVGIAFAFERIVRQPNTVRPHSVIAAAADGTQQEAVVEALFRAYFLDGQDLTDAATIRAAAVEAGLPDTVADQALAHDGVATQVRAADQRARELGVQGVPFFIFNHKVAVSGAHDPDVLLDAIRQAETESAPEAAA